MSRLEKSNELVHLVLWLCRCLWVISAIVRQQVHWWQPFKVSGLISMNLLCCAQQEKVTAKNPPDFYLNKLKSYIDPVTSKSMKVASLFDWLFSFEISYAVYVAGFSYRTVRLNVKLSSMHCSLLSPKLWAIVKALWQILFSVFSIDKVTNYKILLLPG